MNVLLTGGTGFVGINIAEILSSSSDNLVVVYSTRPMLSQAAAILEQQPGKVLWEQGDVQDYARIVDVIERKQIDYIVHAAAITPNAQREKLQMRDVISVNCIGTLNVLEAAKAKGVKRVIYVSSIAVYGDTPQKLDMIKVDAPKNPTNTYEISKFATESLCKRYAELNGMDIVALRLGDVFGAWEYRTGVRDSMSAPCQALYCAINGIPARLQKPGETGWVYGRDTALAIDALLKTTKLSQFAYNCCGVDKWTILDFCKKLREVYPLFSFKVSRKNPNVTFFSEKDNGLFDMEPLMRDTGFTPEYGINEGVAHYLSWAQKYPELTLEEPKR